MAFVTTLGSTLLRLLAQRAHDLRPRLIPAITADDIAQRQHRIDMRPRPVHTAAFQTRLNHQFIAAFNGAVANRPAGRQKRRVLQLGGALLQVGQMRCYVGRRGLCGDQALHFSHNLAGTVVLEFVQLRL